MACLLGGGVGLLPTDTVYGLAVCPAFAASIERVYELKGRPRRANLPVLVDSETALEGLGVDVNDVAKRLLRSPLIPGALTLALGFGVGQRPAWLEGRVEVAIRIPNDESLRTILRETGPLLVTSANAHEAATPATLEDVLLQLLGEPDIAVDGGRLSTVASTLINCRGTPPAVEREGAITRLDLKSYL